MLKKRGKEGGRSTNRSPRQRSLAPEPTKAQSGPLGRAGAPVIFQIMPPVKPDDPLLRILGRVSERRWQNGGRARRKKGSVTSLRPDGVSSKRPKGRWPLDLVKECSGHGMLALRVWRNAGLEPYGLFDGDLIIISLEDPTEGEPAFAAINDNVVIGSYKSGPSKRVTIVPFVDGTVPVTGRARQVQAVFALKAIAYESAVLSSESRVWSRPAGRRNNRRSEA